MMNISNNLGEHGGPRFVLSGEFPKRRFQRDIIWCTKGLMDLCNVTKAE